MAANDGAHALTRAAKEFGDTPVPRTLRDFREQLTEMGSFGFRLGDAITQYAKMLKRPADPGDRRGANINSVLVDSHLQEATECAERIGTEFARLLADFEDIYVKGARKLPNMDLSKT